MICGMPTPETIRVVQIEPGPMPTRWSSAPERRLGSLRLPRWGDIAGDDKSIVVAALCGSRGPSG